MKEEESEDESSTVLDDDSLYEEQVGRTIRQPEHGTDESLVTHALENLRKATMSQQDLSERVESEHRPGKRRPKERGVSAKDLKYMIKHRTLNKTNRLKPWGTIARECGITASLGEISVALEAAGLPAIVSTYTKLGISPPVERSVNTGGKPPDSSKQCSETSAPRAHKYAVPRLSAREIELLALGFLCPKHGILIKVRSSALKFFIAIKTPFSCQLLILAERRFPQKLSIVFLAYRNPKNSERKLY